MVEILAQSDCPDYLIDQIHDLVDRKEYERASALADRLKKTSYRKEETHLLYSK